MLKLKCSMPIEYTGTVIHDVCTNQIAKSLLSRKETHFKWIRKVKKLNTIKNKADKANAVCSFIHHGKLLAFTN